MFAELFGMTIETILFCFIADEEMFAIENRYAEGALMTTIQKTAQDAAKMKVGAKVTPEEADAKDAHADGKVVAQPQGELML